MSDFVNILDSMPVPTDTAVVEIFDPPMCCPTGMCGPTLDQTLLDVNEMVLGLQAEGVAVERYQMTSHPQAFLNNSDVMRLVREKEMAALPITVVRGNVAKSVAYPTRVEINALVNETNS